MFGTSFDTSSDKFQNYYKDLSLRLKNREIDLVIVVNMFLTGFDATTLNTLWVDKNLRAHGLIQAYSRTNRILNSVKTYGNIVSFRDLEQADQRRASRCSATRTPRASCCSSRTPSTTTSTPSESPSCSPQFPLGQPIVGETAQKEFIALFGAILRLRNILQSFDDFAGNEILTAAGRCRTTRASTSTCTRSSARSDDAEKESINDDVVFEIELIKQVEINVDYILMLVEQYRDASGDGDDKEIRAAIERAVDSSPSLRNKKDLIEEFVESLSATVGSRRRVGWRSSPPSAPRNSTASSTDEGLDRDGDARLRREPRSATAPSSRPAQRSPRSCRRSPASRGRRPLSEEADRARASSATFFDRFFGLS